MRCSRLFGYHAHEVVILPGLLFLSSSTSIRADYQGEIGPSAMPINMQVYTVCFLVLEGVCAVTVFLNNFLTFSSFN